MTTPPVPVHIYRMGPRAWSEMPFDDRVVGQVRNLRLGFRRVTVSTVAIAPIDGLSPEEAEIIRPWETAVFPGTMPGEDEALITFRYPTRPDAQRGHDLLVKALRLSQAARRRHLRRLYHHRRRHH